VPGCKSDGSQLSFDMFTTRFLRIFPACAPRNMRDRDCIGQLPSRASGLLPEEPEAKRFGPGLCYSFDPQGSARLTLRVGSSGRGPFRQGDEHLTPAAHDVSFLCEACFRAHRRAHVNGLSLHSFNGSTIMAWPFWPSFSIAACCPGALGNARASVPSQDRILLPTAPWQASLP
jgi:hypothetical protein